MWLPNLTYFSTQGFHTTSKHSTLLIILETVSSQSHGNTKKKLPHLIPHMLSLATISYSWILLHYELFFMSCFLFLYSPVILIIGNFKKSLSVWFVF